MRRLLLALIIAVLLLGAVRRRAVSSPPDVLPGTLTVVASMSEPRAVHTSTLLQNGLVLIAGGLANGSTRSAELYDPAQRAFRRTGTMVSARSEHTATLLPDGNVLIAGGLNTQMLSSSEIYDPATGTFSSGPSMTTRRSGHTAVLLPNGKVLLAGGTTGSTSDWTFLASAELYDPVTRRFTATGGMMVPRASHTAVLLPNGQVLIAGGHAGRGAAIQIYATAELYDPATGTFRPTGTMTHIRHKHAAALLPDGRVLINGGADARDDRGTYRDTEIYNPAIETFNRGPEMQMDRYKHAGTSLLLANGRVLIAGGAAQAEVFDPRHNSFTVVGGEARMRGSFSAVTVLPNGQAIITGGYGQGFGATNAAWLFTP
jgi:hypothetical protein